MKLNRIFIDESITSTKNIKEINISRLGDLVVFVGRNGSGKTRVLDLIEENHVLLMNFNRFIDGSIDNIPQNIETSLKLNTPYKKYYQLEEIIDNKEKKLKDKNQDEELQMEIVSLKNELHKIVRNYANKTTLGLQRFNLNSGNSLIERVNSKSKEILASKVQTINILKNETKYSIIRIKHEDVIRLQYQINEEFSNDEPFPESTITFDSLVNNISNKIDVNIFSIITKSSLSFLKDLPHQLVFDLRDTMGDYKLYSKRKSFKQFNLLKELFSSFFGKDLSWEEKKNSIKKTSDGIESKHSGVWKIDDFEFDYDKLSDGEKTLLTYMLLFFLMQQNSKVKINESIILIDEPELHLHPNSEIDLIEGIRKYITEKGQLIIATHSLNILSHLKQDEIFMVKKGEVFSPSRNRPIESLSELMGIEDRIFKLKEFLNSSNDWAFVNFMTQCLFDPDVVSHSDKSDPQFVSFKNALLELKNENVNVLLDFGAGKGRLLELFNQEIKDVTNFQYYTLEPDAQYHKSLKNLGASKILTKYNEVTQSTFNFIILSNVLHEIQLTEWLTTLNYIVEGLQDNGYLLIIEDRLLPKGEKIGEIGYLILDNESLQELFGLNEEPLLFASKDYSDRIMCSVIPKNKMSKITLEMLVNSISKLQINTLIKIKELRTQDYKVLDNSKGRKNAFYSQQYINTVLALEFLEQEKINKKAIKS